MSNRRIEEPLGPGQQVVVLVFLAMGVWYLAWRPTTFNPDAPVFSWIVYGAEVYGFLGALLHTFMVWRLSRPVLPGPPDPGLSVDVFIPTLDESPDLVRRTLLAARHMAYPHTTWLLDDGNRPEMRTLAEGLGCRYLGRDDRAHGKAGNLNNGLAHSRAELVVVFDADHAPRRDFLLRTLGYFRDPGLAFVQTPQDFYNLDSYQHRRQPKRGFIWTEQSLFFRVILPGKDRNNAAFFAGSCAVVRRSALDDIGGFATGTVTEDLHTSLRLHKRGYRSLYHPESLAFGLAPRGLRPFLRQRVRWGIGAMQVWRREGVVTARGLTLAQRLNYLASMATYFDGWQKVVFYLAPVVVLTTGVMPIEVLGLPFLAHFLPYYLLNFWAFEELARGFGRSVYIEQYNMARFAAFLRATLGWFQRGGRFQVTPKGAGAEDPRWFLVPQSAVLALNAGAIGVGALLVTRDYGLAPGAFAANLFWAGLNTWLAWAVVRFTLRLPHRRREYRFPVALPVRVGPEGGQAQQVALVRDLSPDGLRLWSSEAAPWLEPGSVVAGEVLLPGGAVPFRGEVRDTGESRGGRDVGLALSALQEADRDQLALFLFGSDLQWRFFHLSEAVPTPLETLRRWLGGGRRTPLVQTRSWVPVIWRLEGEEPEEGPGVAALDAEGHFVQLALVRPLAPGSRIRLLPPGSRDGVVVEVEESERLESPTGPFFLFGVTPAAPETEALSHAHILGPSLAPGG
ncbi:MAG TPA: glycosyltransferase family 2 protein [Gammaproteobacteria bacterium]|nr:glycosyltransferase family 2 protein [Gammaproteobacteria bacterium]